MARKNLPKRSSQNSKNAKHHHHHANAALDPATLLARGYTARWMMARTANSTAVLHPLTAEEMDQDLRHMTAFDTACQRYQQHSYVALNEPPRFLAELPITLDPELEKRQQAQKQKLQQAEWTREALEQEYVAVRAHYVETCQQLTAWQQAQQQDVWLLEYLQKHKGPQLALMRTKLQILKEMKESMQYRQQQGSQATAEAATSNNPLLAMLPQLELSAPPSHSTKVAWNGRQVPLVCRYFCRLFPWWRKNLSLGLWKTEKLARKM